MVYAPPGPQQQRSAPRPAIDVKLPSGFDMMLTSIGAVENEVRKTARDMSNMVQQQAMFFERTQETNEETLKALTAISESARETLREVRRSQTPATAAEERERAAEGRGTRPAGVGTRDVPTGGPGPAPAGEWQTTGQMADTAGVTDTTAEVAERRAQQAQLQRYQQARARPVQTFRQDLMQGVTRRISEMESSETPMMLDEATGRWRDSTTGRFAPVAAGEAYARRSQVRNMARNVATQVGNRGVSQGLLHSLPSGAVRTLGTGAAVVGAVEGGLQIAERSRAAGVQYQSALGVSAAEAQLERGRSAMFTMGQRGVMGRQQAGQLYQGVTALGLGDERRDAALDFGTDMYRQLGMSVSESMDVVRVAIANGERSFGSFARSLEGVTEAAVEAGTSAQEARRSFMENYSQIADVIGGGEAAISAAAAQTAGQEAMGHRLSDIQNQMYSDQHIRMVASRVGMTASELQTHMAVSPEGQEDFMRWSGDARTDAMRSSGSFGEGGVDRFDARAQEILEERGYANVDLLNLPPDLYRTISHEMQREGIITADQASIEMQLAHWGFPGVTGQAAVELFTRMIMGAGPDQAAIHEVEQQRERRGISEADFTTETELTGRHAPTGAGAAGDIISSDMSVGAARRDVFGGGFSWSGLGSNARRERRVQESYIEQAMETGLTSGLLEEQIIGGDQGRYFNVRVGDERRVVDWETAVRDFSDQLLSGEATIYSGEGAGESIAERYGVHATEDELAQWQEAMGGSSMDRDDLADIGMSIEEAQEELQGDSDRRDGDAVGHLYIHAGPGLDNVLEFQTEGDLDILFARDGGVPPSGGQPVSQRPTS